MRSPVVIFIAGAASFWAYNRFVRNVPGKGQ